MFFQPTLLNAWHRPHSITPSDHAVASPFPGPQRLASAGSGHWRQGALSLTFGLLAALDTASANAVPFVVFGSMDLPGFDLVPESPLDINPPLGSDQSEIDLCQMHCHHNANCMAYTWVRRGVQGPTGKCWFKASSRIFDNLGIGLMSTNSNTVTGVKRYSAQGCWARHWGNFKICNTFFARTNAPFFLEELRCPAGSRSASVSNGWPGGFNTYCVTKLAHDPGGLPNCTDAFGGESGESWVLGNQVNQACLDTP